MALFLEDPMNEKAEMQAVIERVKELMSGGPLGDGIGPGRTCRQINEEFGTNYEPVEIWRMWRHGEPWADPRDDIYP